MKGILTVTIDEFSSSDLKQAMNTMMNACQQGRQRINNGAKVRISTCNADNPQELQSLMGKLKWWSLGREEDKAQPKKKGWLRHLLEDDW
jgi:hypothetical protein